MLNRILLVACVCIIVATVFYLFYWNRLVAWILGFIFRVLYWHQDGPSLWLEIGSIHFSILTGRILLKDLRYHSSNQTIRIVKTELAWRYWIRRPTDETEIGFTFSQDKKALNRSLSCRVQISFQGFEWFLYNRTAAYDNIIAQMHGDAEPAPSPKTSPRRPSSNLISTVRTPQIIQDAVAWFRCQLPNLDPKDLLPLGILVTKGVITCGNASTSNLLVAEFRRAQGTFGLVPSRSKHDLYRQVLTLSFQDTVMRLVENADYRDSMPAVGELANERIQRHSPTNLSSYLSFKSFGKLWRYLSFFLEPKRTPRRRPSHKKHRKSVEDTIGEDFLTMEYAIERTILETPIFELCYYTDVAGDVPADRPAATSEDPYDIGNGDAGPEWGMDIIITRGFLRYGPWADRRRAELQKIFFPPSYHHAFITPSLQPGDKRAWTAMKIFVELREQTVLNIPFREPSKNWQWDGVVDDFQGPRDREPAWIHLTAGDSSSISYVMPIVAGPKGYEPILEVHLDTVAVTSSLNDIRLVSAESCRIRGDLPSPLEWNAERTWLISVSLRQPVLYLIRDHINMFTDLGKDWVSGPPSDYFKFIPTVYEFQLDLYHFELNLFANDHNIIDKPRVREDNTLFVLHGPRLKTETTVPSNVFHPDSTEIRFSIDAPDLLLNLSLPRWNTYALHVPKEGTSLAKVHTGRIEGSYRYYSNVREEHIDQLKLSITASNVVYKLLGWSVRHFIILKDNYFGSFTQFSTLYEYLNKRERGLPQGDPVVQKYRKGKNNMFQVEMLINVQDGGIIMPVGLPGYETSCTRSIGRALILTLPELQLQFRMHDYYMEMTLNVDTIRGRIGSDCPEKVGSIGLTQHSNEILVIDGIDITANRLFGPLPRTITYVCLWEIDIGHVRTIASANDGALVMAALRAFLLNFADPFNAPAQEFMPSIYPDLTFMKLSLSAVDATWKAGHASLSISLPRGLRLDTNDLGGQFHRKMVSLRLPRVVLRTLLASETNQSSWLEAGEFSGDCNLDIYLAPVGWQDKAQAQAIFVQEQDQLTGRAQKMFDAVKRRPSVANAHTSSNPMHLNGVYLPQPTLSSYRRYRGESQSMTDKGRRLTRLSNSSQSDVDGLPEADRDALLARTRSETLTPHPEDDDLTSGDESDTEELSESDSDSDWSRLETPISEAQELFRQYSRLVRHYSAKSLDRPYVWDGSPFTQTKGNKLRSFRNLVSRPGYLEVKPLNLPPPVKDANSTVFRFASQEGIEIRITPLILSVLTRLEVDVEDVALTPEVSVDAMLISHVNGFQQRKPSPIEADMEPKVSYKSFDTRIASLRVLILQHVGSSSPATTQSPESTSSMTSVELQLEGAHVMGRIKSEDNYLSGSFTRLSVAVDADQNISTDDHLLFFSIDQCTMGLAPDNVHVNIGDVAFSICHACPQYLLAISEAVLEDVKRLKVIRRRWKSSSAAKLGVVGYILDASTDHDAIDPLSAIQPLYLVQCGLPQDLRTDPVFRFLFYLRNSLWHIRERDGHGPVHCGSLSLDELKPKLELRLTALDPDLEIQCLIPIFPNLKPSFSAMIPEIRYTFGYASVRVDSFQLMVVDSARSQPPSSELTSTDITFVARYRLLDFLETVPTYRQLSTSQSSLRNQLAPVVRKLSVSFIVGDTTLRVLSHLMRFAQEVLRVRRLYASTFSTGTEERTDKPIPDKLDLNVDVTLCLQQFRVQTVAENLIFELGSSDLQATMSLFRRQRDLYTTNAVLFEDLFVRARPGQSTKQNDEDILASLALEGGRFTAVNRNEVAAGTKVRLVLGLRNVHFRVPRSALRLYRFIEEWRADFLPEIEATVQALMSELESPSKVSSTPRSRRTPSVQLHVQVDSFGIFLQVMHGTWLTWEVNNTIFYMHSSIPNTRGYTQTFEMQTESQRICVASSPDGRSSQSKARIKLDLPSITVSGSLAGSSIRVITLVDFFEVKVKPSHWDTLLAVQQKFGHDFNDLVSLVQRTRQRKSPTSPKAKVKKLRQPLITSLFWKMRGFRIGLEGLASTLYFECLNIDGKFATSPIRTWSVTLSDLALSLASRASIEPQSSIFNRRQRSAFVTIDVKINGGTNQEESAREVLKATITKIHAVMQPSSIGEFGDFVDYLQAEMLGRKEQRAQEMTAFKLKAQSILKTFELKDKDTDEKPAPVTSWLNKYIIDLAIRNFGVAFPLTLTPDLQLPQSGRHDSGAVKAFLFSIKSLKFSAQRGETGQATMKGFSFQFVSRFRQSMPTDFLGENHQTRNRLVYPEMTAQLRSQGSAMSREVLMRANVSGFILDLDSSIPDYVFSLIDVYRHGKDRVAQLTSTLPPLSARDPKPVTIQPLEQQPPILPASNFYAFLTFLSGKVRLYSRTAATMSKSKSFTNGVTDLTDQQVLEVGAEIFNLPVVSVWTEYRASRKLHSEMGSSILMFKSTVHSSQNTLRPTLLPFVTEVTGRVENRLRTATKSPRSTEYLSTTLGPAPQTPLALPSALQEAESASSMQISFSLRIDQSKLELTCQPDVNVIAGLHWDSGGFIINVSPRARKVTFTGTVGGLTVGLKHGFLSDECVKLDARNLAFSVTFAKMDTEPDQSISFASLVIDTEFLGAVRFSRLQDVLCFKAVWLDHIPILNGNGATPVQPTAVALSESQSLPQRQEFTNVILARIRQVKLDIDLGQSITTVVLDVSDAVFRTKLTDTMNQFSLWVGDFRVAGTGNVAGQISVANCLFETIRRRDNLSKDGTGHNRMLELRLTSGPLTAVLESDHQRLLHYRAEPLEVEIWDDWSMITPEIEQKQRPLLLTFTVNSPEIVAVATVGTIPKLLLYANKFQANLEAQREGASRESQTFRVSRSPQPDNPLSAVAEAMLQSARSRFKEGSGLSYVISQRMSLRLDLLRLFVFPRNMGDMESAQFVARSVRAELNRVVLSYTKRDIQLAFSSMVISRFTQLGHNLPNSPEFSEGKEWLNTLLKGSSEAEIVGLPSMKIHMESDEVVEDGRKILSYNFNSKFVRDLGGEDFGEDIYITLNVGLYSWLTLLRKSLTREMDQVKAISNVTGPSSIPSRRKGAVELPSLSIMDSPKSAATAKSFPMSPLSPVMHRFGFPPREPVSASLPSSQAWTSSPPLGDEGDTPTSTTPKAPKNEKTTIIFQPRTRHIERLTMRQLGEATPDVMHPFFMKKAGFSLEDSFPQYVHEYATTPLEEIMEVLQKLYSKQLTITHT